jgi:SAM-dependent methyltransferase
MSRRKRGDAADWDSYAAFYDWENRRTFGRRDIRWWTQFLPRNGRVLELGSGTGRLIIPLARSGAEMTGVDFSSAMLARARRRVRRLPAGLRPTLIRGDMRALPFPARSYAAALAPYGVLQSLTSDADLDTALAETARVLKRGAPFGIDLVPDLAAWQTYQNETRFSGRLNGAGVVLVESVRQNRRQGTTIFDETFVVTRGRRKTHHRFSLTFRSLSMDAMRKRLRTAGFSIDSIHGDYTGGDWRPESDAWIISARRN